MRVLFSGIILALALLVASPVAVQGLITVGEAYARGDYLTAQLNALLSCSPVRGPVPVLEMRCRRG